MPEPRAGYRVFKWATDGDPPANGDSVGWEAVGADAVEERDGVLVLKDGRGTFVALEDMPDGANYPRWDEAKGCPRFRTQGERPPDGAEA